MRGLTYEAYEEEATRRLAEIADGPRRRWPDVERVALLHRLGDLELSEASVIVVGRRLRIAPRPSRRPGSASTR